MVFLGVNIDHVATIRNARGGVEPDPVEAAIIAEQYGADGITAHLREDRRHIRDEDIFNLKKSIKTRLNLEMAATEEMVLIALKVKPCMVTLVPERREELTTEGGLNAAKLKEYLKPKIKTLSDNGIVVSIFIDPVLDQAEACAQLDAHMVELHTGEYANAFLKGKHFADQALKDLIETGSYCNKLGLKVNAGHGLTNDNVKAVLQIPNLVELNIGHHIISKAVFTGLGPAVKEMKQSMAALTILPSGC